MSRIQDRFTAPGRKLSVAEQAAVVALHAKYPDVPLRATPGKRVALAKPPRRAATGTQQQVDGLADKAPDA